MHRSRCKQRLLFVRKPHPTKINPDFSFPVYDTVYPEDTEKVPNPVDLAKTRG